MRRITRPQVTLLSHMSLLTVTAARLPVLRCRLGMHRFRTGGTAPGSPWIVLADECACGAQRPLPL